jgi:multiple sugar transport system ATP-binding protein
LVEIRFENLTKKFGKVVAVDKFNLSIKDQEFVTLVGPSGCGKTTTLNMLAGLEDPSEGLIYIDNEIANVQPPGKRNIAMVFQSYALYPHMDVFNNIAFGLRVRKVKKDEIIKKVHEAAKLLGIEELLNRKPGELSGGQRQRVALGRAIVRNPKVFLLDEPLSNLDAKLRIQMRADLRLLFERLKGTVVYVTHDQAEAMTLSDRVVVMKDGFIQQVGPPEEVYDHPKNIFVGGFLGSPTMNFIDCILEEKKGDTSVRAQNFEVNISKEKSAKIKEISSSENLVIGIRPEDIKVGKTDSFIACKVEVVENMGSGSIIYLRIGDTRVVATTERVSDIYGGLDVNIGFNLDKLHIFDKKTEIAAF